MLIIKVKKKRKEKEKEKEDLNLILVYTKIFNCTYHLSTKIQSKASSRRVEVRQTSH